MGKPNGYKLGLTVCSVTTFLKFVLQILSSNFPQVFENT